MLIDPIVAPKNFSSENHRKVYELYRCVRAWDLEFFADVLDLIELNKDALAYTKEKILSSRKRREDVYQKLEMIYYEEGVEFMGDVNTYLND